MHDPQLAFSTDLTDLEPNQWLAELDDICDDLGFFEQIGTSHCACFLEAGNKLLVTFENAETVRTHNTDAEPRGFAYARHDGWSHLAVISFSESWFRDPAIFAFFDRMIDDGFFEDFEKIVFHGTGPGAYAASVYSVAAPGATVIALRPQATLDPALTAWDPRYKCQRKQDFTSRYGYAPDMIEGAGTVFVAFDPSQRLDAIHAALFRRPNVTYLPCPLLGTHLDKTFDRLGIHDVVIKLAMDGALDARRFAQLLRARRYDVTYARTLVNRLAATNHRGLARMMCHYMLKREKDAFFSAKLRELNAPMSRPMSAPLQTWSMSRKS